MSLLLKNNKFFLILVFTLSFLVRVAFTESTPPHLNWDEVSHGYNAYSILTTGKDEWGEPYPTIFRAYGDYKLPVYIYATVPSVAAFGLNSFSVRLASILAGSLTVAFVYLLSLEIFKDKKTALFSAILVALEPWGFFLSRVALEANLALFLFVSGIYFLHRGVNKKPQSLVIGSILLGTTVWTYNSFRIFSPLILFAFVFIYRTEVVKTIKKARYIVLLSFLLLLLFLLPMFSQLVSTQGSARYENVKILDQGAIHKIVTSRNSSELPPVVAKLAHNKYTYFGSTFFLNYVSHFSPDFLFKSGGDNFQFNLPNYGLINFINFPFFIIGFVYLSVKFRKNKSLSLLFFWLLFSPVAASVTRESPHTLRSIMMFPVLIILISVGITKLLGKFKNAQSATLVYLVLVLLLFIEYFNIYLTDYTRDYSWAWQQGHQQAVNYLSENYENYDKIIFSKKYGEPHEFLLFYGASTKQSWASPELFMKNENLVRFEQSNWFWVDRFDKFYFVNDWEIPESGTDPWVLESGGKIPVDEGSVLLLTSPGNFPKDWTRIDSILFLNGDPAFDVVVKI